MTRYNRNPDRIAHTENTVYRTLHVYEEAEGTFAVVEDKTGAVVKAMGTERDEFGVLPLIPLTGLTFEEALDAAQEEAYDDFQAEESARLEHAADPHGIFL